MADPHVPSTRLSSSGSSSSSVPPRHPSAVSVNVAAERLSSEYRSRIIQRDELKFSEDVDHNPDRIGRGAFGDVYKARWLREDGKQHEVAVKVVSLAEHQLRYNFVQEVLLLEHMGRNSPHSITLHGAFNHDGKCYIVMEYLPEGTLHGLIHNKSVDLTWDVKLHLFLRVADVVADLHSHDIVHHDLKPDNLLIYVDERVQWQIKICDLGLAETLRSWTTRGHSKRRKISEEKKNVLVGTAPYLPPEYLEHPSEWDKAMDMYSVGIILWEIAFRRYPYGSWDRERIEAKVPSGARPDRRCFLQVPESWRNYFEQMVERCWNKDPSLRPTALGLKDSIADIRNQVRATGLIEKIKDGWRSWSACNSAIEELDRSQLALSSDQVHIFMAMHLLNTDLITTARSAELRERYGLPNIPSNDYPEANAAKYRRDSARIHRRYMQWITDMQLNDEFIAAGFGDPTPPAPMTHPALEEKQEDGGQDR